MLGGALNFFVALDEIDECKGQLWVAPASHLNVSQIRMHWGDTMVDM